MRVKDHELRAIFERYGYDPDDPVRGRDVPDRLLRMLAETRFVEEGEPLERANQHDLPLTEKELEVLELLACGRSYKEIAASQGIVLGTVGSRLGAVYSKLGAYNAPHAVAIGIAQRLIPHRN